MKPTPVKTEFWKTWQKIKVLSYHTKKKNIYNPLVSTSVKPLPLNSLPDNIAHTAVPMPKIDFVREMIDRHCDKQEDLVSVDDLL